MSKSTNNIFSSLTGFTVLLAIVFGVLHFFGITPIDLKDWGIGIGCFWWLMIITTLPWNTHFKAKEILNDIEGSLKKDLKINQEDIKYAKKISTRYLIAAILLHIISAIGLASLSYFGYSDLGYFGAVLAILLTFLRPSIRLYEYVAHRLNSIQQEVKYPREDIHLVKDQIYQLEETVKKFEEMFDHDNPDSYVSTQQVNVERIQKNVQELNVNIETLKVENKTEHELLARKSEEAIAQISEDSQFLNHAREIIRFFKKA